MYRFSIFILIITTAFEAHAEIYDIMPQVNQAQDLIDHDTETKMTGSGTASGDASTGGDQGAGAFGFKSKIGRGHGAFIYSPGNTNTLLNTDGNYSLTMRDPSLASSSFVLIYNQTITKLMHDSTISAWYVTLGNTDAVFSNGTTSVDGTILSYGFGLIFRSKNLISSNDNHVSAGAQIGFSGRSVIGEFATDSVFRETNFNMPEKTIIGLELAFYIDVKDVRYFWKITNFKTQKQITGLSGLQTFVGTQIQADFFTF